MRQERWSAKARKEYLAIIQYLFVEWSENASKAFVEKTENIISSLKVNPRIFKTSKKRRNTHLAFITKHTTMVYRHKGRTIHILSFQDNRQNPETQKY